MRYYSIFYFDIFFFHIIIDKNDYISIYHISPPLFISNKCTQKVFNYQL